MMWRLPSDHGASALPRIVYHLNSLEMGGMESHALTLACGVARAGWHVSVLLPKQPIFDPLSADFAAAGITTHRVTMTGTVDGEKGTAGPAAAWLKTRALLRQTGPWILHQHRSGWHQGKWVVLAARAAGVPVVVASEHQAPFRLARRQRWIRAAVDRLVDRFVVVSDHDYCRQLAESGRPPDKILRIYNGIDASCFQPAAAELVAARRAALGIPAGAPVIGVVGRLVEQKGITFLLRSLPALRQRWPGLTALVAGDGALRQALEAEAGRLGVAGYTRFLGFTSDTPGIMSLMDVVVMPSLTEPFGLVAAEAMSMGRAVVASRVGGLPEVVEDGESGLLVPPGDPQSLTVAVDRLLADPALRDRLAAAGRQRVAAHFTMEVMTERMLALYQDLIHPHRQKTDGRKGAEVL